MTYYTHIPDTTYAQRRRSFLILRAEARRSLGDCEVLHDTWVRKYDAQLSRNSVDAPVIKRSTKMITKMSNMMRELRLVALHPDPPRHEPVTESFDADEARTYGGVKASRLVRVLRFIRRFRRTHGEELAAKRVSRVSNKLMNGLDIYKRVKALVRTLMDAVDTPETAVTPRRPKPSLKQVTPRAAFKWDVSPQKIYGWRLGETVKGYDARQTSVYWLKKQSTALKHAVYREHHGIKPTRPKPRAEPQHIKIETRIYHPPQGAQVTDEIWPPIDLVRLIEERRSHTPCPPAPDCRTNTTGTQEFEKTNYASGFEDVRATTEKETDEHYERPKRYD